MVQRIPTLRRNHLCSRSGHVCAKIGAWQFKEGKYITEYDDRSPQAGSCNGRRLSQQAQWVSEQYILIQSARRSLVVW
jgi:hypothetical protein